jgi:hypothetical protein
MVIETRHRIAVGDSEAQRLWTALLWSLPARGLPAAGRPGARPSAAETAAPAALPGGLFADCGYDFDAPER